MTRTGKIARLPRDIREELNRRLRDGEQGKQLVVWLNSLPETRSVLEEEFGGRAIREQNLTEWKQRGYRDWVARQQALEFARNFAADAGELTKAGGPLGDHLATALMARYAAIMSKWDGTSETVPTRELRLLRALCVDIVELRRGDHSAARLKLEHARLELDRSKDEARLRQRFEEWVKQPQVKERVCGKLSPEERQRRISEIFGRPKAGLSAEALAIIEKAAKIM